MSDPTRSAAFALAPRWRKVLRDAWLHKARSALVVAAVALSMTAAGALLDAWALVRRATQESYAATHPAAASLRVDRAVDAALLAQIRAHPAIASARVRGRVFGAVQIDGTRVGAELFALTDFAARDIAAVDAATDVAHGSWPPRDGEIAIEQSSLEFAGAALGQLVEVTLAAQTQRLRIAGVAHDVGLPPGWMDHVAYGFVTPATLAAFGVEPALNEVQFVLRDTPPDRAAVRGIADDVRALLERGGIHVQAIDVPEPGQHPHAGQMDSLMFTQGAFGVLTLLVASFLIVNLIGALLAGQTRQIGVMQALGASPRQIGALYLAFAALLGLLAALLALPAALAIGRPYAMFKAQMLNFSVAGFAVPWWTIALQVGVGCLLPVLAAALPVARACRMRVAVALRDPGIATEHGAYLRRRLKVPGLSRPLLLSLGNAFRRRQRTLLTLLALAAGGAVFIAADNLRASMYLAVERMFASQHYDAVLRLATPATARDIEAAARAVDGVEHAQALLTENATIVHADGTPGEALTLLGIPPDTPLFEANMERGRWLDRGDERVLVLTQRLLRAEPQLQPDTDVTLNIGGKPSRWHVVGADQTVVQNIAYAPFTTVAALHGNTLASMLAVAARGGNAAVKLDVIMRLRAALGEHDMRVAGSQLLSETRRAVEDHLLMVIQFLGAMAWVMIAVGGMGLASTMSMAVLERTREIGVMRAIGARHGVLMRMIQAEGLVIAVLAWLVALPLSAPISLLLADAFGRIMFPVPAQLLPNARAALLWLLLAASVSLLACFWPGRRAMRVSTASALSYE